MAYKHFLAQCEEIEIKKATEPSHSSQNDFKSEVIEAPDLSKSCPVKTNPDESLSLNTFNLTSQATSSQERDKISTSTRLVLVNNRLPYYRW